MVSATIHRFIEASLKNLFSRRSCREAWYPVRALHATLARRRRRLTPQHRAVTVNVDSDTPQNSRFPGVLVTREDPRPVLDAIKLAGGRAVAMPLLHTRWLPFDMPSGMTLDSYDFVAFTSVRALHGLDAAVEKRGWNWPPKSAAAAVGDRTAHELQARGWMPECVSQTASARSLAQAMIRHGISAKRILFPCSAIADATFPDTCRDAGALVDVLPVYTTEPAWSDKPARRLELQSILRDNLQQGCVITCASPSAVKVMVDLAESASCSELLLKTPIVVIGPTTERAARKRSLQTITCEERTFASMARKAVETVRALSE